jgi:DNA-binding Lrp family transcriptional regulator
VDDIDRRVLQLLKEDGRATNAEVGEKIGLSEGAVRRRIARMRADGTILRFTAVTLPLGPEGLVLVRCRPGKTSAILDHVRQRATEVFESSGEYDLGAIIECGSMDALNRELDAIRAMDGVDATLTLIRLTRWQKNPPPGSSLPGPESSSRPPPPGRAVAPARKPPTGRRG